MLADLRQQGRVRRMLAVGVRAKQLDAPALPRDHAGEARQATGELVVVGVVVARSPYSALVPPQA
eukprot:12358062-Heterocapsa_arctica.AAC.1